MSETVSRPWILSYLLNIAQTVGTDLTRLKWEKGGRRAQLIDFITYPREDHIEDAIWARLSDKIFHIPVKFTDKCIAEYNSINDVTGTDDEEPRLTTKRYASVVISEFKLIFAKVPLQNNQGIDQVYHLALEVNAVRVIGGEGEGTFANPKDLEEDEDLRLWINGLRAQDGSGNILMEERRKNSRNEINVTKRKRLSGAQNHLPFAPNNPSDKKAETMLLSGRAKGNIRVADGDFLSARTLRVAERRKRSTIQWEKFANNIHAYTFIPDHYAVQHNDILVFGEDRKDKCDLKEQTNLHDDDVAPLPKDFSGPARQLSPRQQSNEDERQSTPLVWPPSDDEEMDLPPPKSQASQPSARLDSDDERDALDVQCSIAPDLSDDREENENAPTQDAEQAAGSENENEIDKQEVQIKSVVASVPSSTSSVRLKPSTNEELVADTSIVSGASQHEESLLLSQSVILHEKKHIQILVPDSDISMAGSQSQSQNIQSLSLSLSQSQSHPQPIPFATPAPRVLVADSSQSQSQSQQDSQTTKSSKTESDSQPNESLSIANNTYRSPVVGSLSTTRLQHKNAVAGPSNVLLSQDMYVSRASSGSAWRRTSKNGSTPEPGQQLVKDDSDDELEQFDVPIIDEDDLQTHGLLASSLTGSSKSQSQRTTRSSTSTKSTSTRASARKRRKDPEEGEVEGMSNISLLSPSELHPQKRRRRLSHSREDPATGFPHSEVPRLRNKRGTVEPEDRYSIERVDHDVNAWKAPSFAQQHGVLSKPNASSPRDGKIISTPAPEPTSILISNETVAATASKKLKPSDIHITRSNSVASVSSSGVDHRSRGAQISDKNTTTSSYKSNETPLLPTTSNGFSADSASAVPPRPRLLADFSSVAREMGPKWLTWSDAADVLTLIGRLKNLRGRPT